jgi:hypothetical protein
MREMGNSQIRENKKGRDHMGDPDIGGRVILKWILKK